MLGICNGFQALVKLGLIPFGEIRDTDGDCPTLTYNAIGRHQSSIVRTRVCSSLSPCSAILITLSCLSENAVVFNVEVRMYSWGSLFLLLSFYELYCILQIDNRRNYLLFALFSLAAAYTHYYCLIAVAFYYIVLLYLVFKRKYLNMRKVILCCTATVLGYLPWLVILVKSIKRVKDSYWINDIPTIKECVEYLFSNHFQPVVWGGIAIAGLMFILYETRILSVKKNEKGFLLRLTFDDASISENLIWMSAGIFSIVGTMMIGIIVSKVMRPVFLVRYLYPVSVVAWVLLGVIISRVKGRGLYTVLILLYLRTRACSAA